MRFLVRKRRSAPAVIIVALIDVLIVLVIFLLVTTTFKQPTLKLNLPTSSSALKSGANENPPLIVNIDATGQIRYGRENLPMTLIDLRGELVAQAEKNPNVKLAVRADEKAPWGRIVGVMDIADEAHIKILSAYAKEANKQ
jgi:biopolymer transport protein ExbD